MSGLEAWMLISPYIGAMIGKTESKELISAYVLIYSALKYWDEHNGTGEENT